jgi:hypothetical protein
MIQEIINDLLDLNFLCVEVDDDAKDLVRFDLQDILKKDNVEKGWGFISFNRIEAIKKFNDDRTLENHHIAIHWILIDKLIFKLTKKDWTNQDKNIIQFLAGETLKCSNNKKIMERIINLAHIEEAG